MAIRQAARTASEDAVTERVSGWSTDETRSWTLWRVISCTGRRSC